MNTTIPSGAGVLERLREGGWISGQALCEALHCTRAAIWKQIEALRRRGYAIDARPRWGYRLTAAPETPLPAEVQPRLATACLGRNLVWLPTVDSTNRWLSAKADAGAPEGLVVAADIQTEGRGRLDRAWCTPPGDNLAFSVLLRPAVPLDRVASLSLLLALAVRRAVLDQAPGLEPRIKWPNDIWIQGRKLGGILCDMQAEPDRVRHVVAGIGLNVNAEANSFPPAIRATATSLKIAAGRAFSRAALLAALLNALEPLYRRWERDGLNPFLAELAGADLLAGRTLTLDQGPHALSGRADGIAPDGALRLAQPGGPVRLVYSGDVHVRRLAKRHNGTAT